MTDCISLVYVENDIELSRPIKMDLVCNETRKDNDVTDLIGAVYIEKKTKLS